MTTNETPDKKSTVESFSPGQTIGENFTLKQKLSSGDTGIQWLARDLESDKDVSLLFIPAVLLGDSRTLDELRIQVKQNRQLIHPHVLRTHDFIEEEGWAAISSDAVEGETLASLLAKKPKHAFDPSEIKPWLSTICQTLDDAHRANLLHRDLGPQSILVKSSGELLLANFGIVRIILDALARTPARGKIDEHLAYMSPQQLDGEHPARWDDVYSLGVLIYHLLTGAPPFHTGDILPQIRKNSPASISDRRTELGINSEPVPQNWEKVVAACLEKHTPQRPKSAREVGVKIGAEISLSSPASAPVQVPAQPAVAKTAAPKAVVETPKVSKKTAEPAAPKEPKPSKEALVEDIVWRKSGQRPKPEPGEPVSFKHLLEQIPEEQGKKKSPGFKIAAIAGVCVVALVALLWPKGTSTQTTVTQPSPTPIGAIPSTPEPAPSVAKVASPTPAVANVQPTKTPGILPPSVPLEKIRALEQARKTVEDATKGLQEKTNLQKQTDSDAVKAKAAADEKSVALVALKKALTDTSAMRKDREDAEAKAATDAEEAQKAAAEKARIASDAKLAKEQLLKQIKDQEDAQQKADADMQALQKAAAQKQQAADDAAKAAKDAATQLEQQQAALKQLESEVSQQITSVAATPTPSGLNIQSGVPQPSPGSLGMSSGTEGLPLIPLDNNASPTSIENAEKVVINTISQGKQTPPEATPQETVPVTYVANPKSQIDKTMENSLGMKFKPVGDVLFCVWLVRVQDFEAFARATHFKGNSWLQPGFKQGPDHPVVNVTWNDAMAFCKWLTEKEQKAGLLAPNQVYRLPTDMEWSKAVGLPEESGKTPESRDMDVTDQYPWGKQWPPPPGAGNYTGEETSSDVAIKGYDDGFGFTSPVGSFAANKYGLFDVGGNAWQWCMDWWNGEQKSKVLRGASWYNGGLKLSLLSSCRTYSPPDVTTDNFGFRCVIATETKSRK